MTNASRRPAKLKVKGFSLLASPFRVDFQRRTCFDHHQMVLMMEAIKDATLTTRKAMRTCVGQTAVFQTLG